MKQLLLVMGIVAVLFACNTQKKALEINRNGGEVASIDSIEYDVETFDNKFATWYALHNIPARYHSQAYYESWNQQYVNAWNNRCAHPSANWKFEPVIGYEPGVDYGFEMNHKLFYYFMYVENVLKVNIIPGGPKVY